MKSYVAHCQSGYYVYDRTVVVDRKLRDHEYAQCGINGHGTLVQFVSYETIVCEIDNGWLHCFGTFSTTTAKQIGWFMRQMKQEYGYRIDLSNYQTAKRAYEKGIEINLYNGDERKAADGMIQTVGMKVRV